jgi:hypothetical protein
VSDGRFLAAFGLFAFGCALMLAEYGLRRSASLVNPSAAVPQRRDRTLAVGMLIAALGLAISSGGVIERLAWTAVMAWAAFLALARSRQHPGVGDRR